MKWQTPVNPPTLGETFTISVLTDLTVNLEDILKKQKKTKEFWIQKIEKSNVGQKSQWTVSIVYFRSGEWPLPQLEAGVTETIKILKLANFQEVEVDQAAKELKPSPSAMALPTPYVLFILWAVGALGAIIGGWAAWRWWRQRQSKVKLDSKKYTYKNVMKWYQSQILNESTKQSLKDKCFFASELVRGYAQYCSRYPFLGMTTEELNARDQEWTKLLRPHVDETEFLSFLRVLDSQKFVPETSHSHLDFNQGFKLIEKLHELDTN